MENWLRGLTKSQKDKWIGGVCGGLGQHRPFPSWVWRFLFSFLFLWFGTE
jgi:phage shock protein C